MTVSVDREKLAEALEDGIDPSHCSFYRGLRLSFPICGVASTAVKLYAQDMGFPAELVVSSSTLPFGVRVDHVMTVINDNPDNPYVIDPTWGQFLRYVGWDEAYDKMTDKQIFPREVLAFRLNQSEEAIKNMAKAAICFRKIEQNLVNQVVPADIDGERVHLGADWLPGVKSEKGMIKAFGPIWDPKNFSPFEPGKETYKKAKSISQLIQGGIIKVG